MLTEPIYDEGRDDGEVATYMGHTANVVRYWTTYGAGCSCGFRGSRWPDRVGAVYEARDHIEDVMPSPLAFRF